VKNLFKLVLVLVLVAGIVVFAGCGKKEEAPAPAEEPAEEKVYIVGTEPTFPPFEMIDTDSGEIIGFDIDLINAIAEDQGFKVEIVNLGFDGLIPAVQTGNIDIIASGMTIKEERKEMVDFSEPYINAGLALATSPENTDITSVEDLGGKTVAVQIGTTGAEKANELLEAGMVGEVKTFNTTDLVMMELINGGVDAVINDLPVTQAYITRQPGKIVLVGEPLTSESYGFAVQKDNTELLEKINAGLANVIASGKYAEIEVKFFE